MVAIRPLSLALLTLALVLPASASAVERTRIIVKRDPGLGAAERRDIRDDANVDLVRTLAIPRTEVVAAQPGEAQDALRALNADKDVAYAEVDHKRVALSTPDDEYFQFLWAFDNHGQVVAQAGQPGTPDADSDVLEAWSASTGVGQTVAVVDTGVYGAHEDLGSRVVDAENFVGDLNGDPGAPDTRGHGTHVSGTIAAVADNGVGVAGIAPDSKVMALKALDDTGSGFDSDIAEAFRYAGENGVRIVNASFGGAGNSATLRDAIADFPDTLFVVAAGNGGADEIGDDNDVAPQFPCNVPEPNVLCVGASTNRDERAPYSNYGDQSVDVFAPGDAILSTVPPTVIDGSSYDYLLGYGTSAAAPVAAATAALVLQVASDLTAPQIRSLLMETGDYKAPFAGRSVSGRRVNADAAVRLALAGGPQPDGDSDGVADAADACRTVASSDLANGCPDRDRDGVTDASDNCPTVANANQANSDRRNDGGDACDSDLDNDGRPNAADACPTKYALTANGCAVAQPVDRDRDGFLDTRDACPTEFAHTLNGCPLPAVTALSATVRARRASIAVRASRPATVQVTVERRSAGRWLRVTRRTLATSANRVSMRTRRLRPARYRAAVVLTSGAGRTPARTRRFRVR